MRQEHDKNIWKRIKRVTSTSTGRTCMEVQVCNGNWTTTFMAKQDIERAIQSDVKGRFKLGNSTLISCTLLGIDLRHLNNAEVALSIIDGSFPIPHKLDNATKQILHKIGIMGNKVLKGNFSPTLEITAADYVLYHKRIREATSFKSGQYGGQTDDTQDSLTSASLISRPVNPSLRGVVVAVALTSL